MALRLSDLVVCGELLNTRHNSVHGYIGLRGFERPLMLDLTGNCAPDLAGRHIRFEARSAANGADDPGETLDAECDGQSEAALLEKLNLTGLAWQQIGPVTAATAARMVRVSDCPPKELYLRAKLDEPPPTEWKRCLYLEWSSQNGDVVIELVDPEIEFVPPDEAGVSPAGSAETEQDENPFTSTPCDDDDAAEDEALDDMLPDNGDEDSDEQCCSRDCGDSYHLFSDDLQRELDRQARETERAWRGQDDENDAIREMELMDDLIEHGEGEPLGTLFDEVVKLPRPEGLDEAGAEEHLHILLAKLALWGVGLHMCEHYTALDAYRLLVEELAKEVSAYRELRGTQWVQWFDTAEHCEECEAEFERDWQARQQRTGGDSAEASGDDSSAAQDDSDMP